MSGVMLDSNSIRIWNQEKQNQHTAKTKNLSKCVQRYQISLHTIKKIASSKNVKIFNY